MPTPSPTAPEPVGGRGLFSRKFLWITIGSCALVFLGAFESLAVTTIMPAVSLDLNGEHLYALAFAGPLATGVIGMVISGNWSDRTGPVVPLYTSAVLFAIGLVVAGLASSMEMLVAGRLIQGLGTGAVIVALYVVVARVYPAHLHPSIFAGFAAAWVIPSLIGPYIAGVVEETFSWHWVFLGVVVLVAFATAMVAPALRALPAHAADRDIPSWSFRRIGWAILAATAVLILAVLAEVEAVGGALAIGAAIVAIVAVRPLLPRGTLLAWRGLPSVILLRGLAAAAFFSAEVYLPHLLVRSYEYSSSDAGLALTFGSLTWALASWLQGRMPRALSHRKSTTIGAFLVLVSIVIVGVTAAFLLPPVIAIAGWVLGGGGMGLMYPRISVMTLAFSNPTNQGFNSSALSIGDSLGAALALAVCGLIYAAASHTGVFAFAAVIAVLALFVAPRVRPADEAVPVQSEPFLGEAA